MSKSLSDADSKTLEASLRVIEEAGRALSAALASLALTRGSIEAILRPVEPESGKRWQ